MKYQRIEECPNICLNGLDCDEACPECSGAGVHGVPVTLAEIVADNRKEVLKILGGNQ